MTTAIHRDNRRARVWQLAKHQDGVIPARSRSSSV